MSSSITEVDIGVEDVSFQEVGNTGGGLELLMNSSLKTKDSSSRKDADSDVDLSDIRDLASKLDDDTSNTGAMPPRKKSLLFGSDDIDAS